MVVSVSNVKSAGGAAQYYSEDGYYTREDGTALSEWGGEGAANLGLSGQVGPDKFEQLLAGNLPNGDTIEGGAKQRVYGLDLTFSLPKGVSLAATIGKDGRIFDAHLKAVRATMGWAEKNLALARQGANGRETVQTGNLVYALFPHLVSRSQSFDPQIHIHAVVISATQRPDGQWRALRNTALYKENTLIGSIYHSEMRANLEKLGYQIQFSGKHGAYDIAGIDRSVIQQWSSRRSEILKIANELGITSAKGFGAIAERSRDTKAPISRADLVQHWETLARERGLDLSALVNAAREATPQRNVFERVRDWGRLLLDRVTHAFGPKPEPLLRNSEPANRGADLAAAYAVAAGVRHLTERQASFEPGQLLRAALNFAEHGTRIAQIEPRIEAMAQAGVLITRNVDGIEHMTTRDVLRTENEIVERAQNGRCHAEPLIAVEAAKAGIADAEKSAGLELSLEQTGAALAVLSGNHRYELVQGDSGTGKTTLFSIINQVAQKRGYEIIALTPQHKLANALREQTGMNVSTVADFLARHQRATGKGAPVAIDRAAAEIGGKIILVDEASMLSSRQMLGLMQIADNAQAARLVLVGDKDQISSPEAGRPFALLQQEGILSARLSENRRQLDPVMREAVAAAKLGQAGRALDLLGDKVKESQNPAKSGAEAWLALSKEERARTAIFTSGHILRSEVLNHVRAGLIKDGTLGREALMLKVYESLHLTHEQMRKASSYAPGIRLEVFEQQKAAGLGRGKYEVTKVDHKSGTVNLSLGGKEQQFQPAQLSTHRQGVALSIPTEIEIRTGDRLMWTTNNKELGITNGNAAEVLAIDRKGITLRDSVATRTIAHDNPMRENLAHSLVLNMHRAQGLTVDRAITVMDSNDRMLNSASLFYVLSSRAREHLGLHVDDKQALADAIGKHRGDVPHARDVAAGKELRNGKCDIGNEMNQEKGLEQAQPQVVLPWPEKHLSLSL